MELSTKSHRRKSSPTVHQTISTLKKSYSDEKFPLRRYGTEPKSYRFFDSTAMFIVAERPTRSLADTALKRTLKTSAPRRQRCPNAGRSVASRNAAVANAGGGGRSAERSADCTAPPVAVGKFQISKVEGKGVDLYSA